MLLVNLGFVLAALVSFVSATEPEAKFCRPCARSSSSSSSSSCSSSSTSSHSCSSSSSSSSCHGCSDEKARRKVKNLQAQAEYYIQSQNVAGWPSISSYDQSFAIYELGCGACCLSTGDATAFINRFPVGDKISFYIPNPDYIKRFDNGTVVVSKLAVQIPVSAPTTVVNYWYNFYWSPEPYGKCNFKLSYIDGNVLNCPNYVFQAPNCGACP